MNIKKIQKKQNPEEVPQGTAVRAGPHYRVFALDYN